MKLTEIPLKWVQLAEVCSCIRNRDSSVGIATGYGLDDQGFRFRVPVESEIFFPTLRPHQLWGPPSLISIGYRGLPGRKRPVREADHSPPAIAKVKKNMDLYIHSPIRLHGLVLNYLSTGTLFLRLSFFRESQRWFRPNWIGTRSVTKQNTT
jgi:hypothetical protein